MDMLKYHEESTRLDMETYALVSYFRLLKQIELANEHGYPIFKLIGGEDTLRALEIKADGGHFDCRKTNQELFSALLVNVQRLKGKCNSLLIEEAIYNGEVIKKFMVPSEDLKQEDALTTLTRALQSYPIDIAGPFLAKLSNDLSEKEKPKTIGQKQI